MIEMSLEIPIRLLDDILPRTDLGFALAHMILKDEHYASMYRDTKHILDNSMYELNEPLGLDELLEAVDTSEPEAVIGPDWEGDQLRTSETSTMLQQRLAKPPGGGHSINTGIVIHGADKLSARDFFHYAQARRFRPICFPFRMRHMRHHLIYYLEQQLDFKKDEWYHLLGLNNSDELRLIKRLPGRWSFDTAKPCKPELNLEFSTGWSGLPKLDFYREYSQVEIEQVITNIEYLKSIYA